MHHRLTFLYRWNQVIASMYTSTTNVSKLAMNQSSFNCYVTDSLCRLLGVFGFRPRNHTGGYHLEATVESEEESGPESTSVRRYLVSIIRSERKSPTLTHDCKVQGYAQL